MKPRNRVLASIETDDGCRCVDVFLRPDGTTGFEEYRRDSEDIRGWFQIGFHAAKVFSSEDDALSAAREAVAWLATASPAYVTGNPGRQPLNRKRASTPTFPVAQACFT